MCLWVTSYMEKQLRLGLVVNLTEGATVLVMDGSMSTDCHLLRAYGLGRFSGTVSSKDFTVHGGHALLSLHLCPPPLLIPLAWFTGSNISINSEFGFSDLSVIAAFWDCTHWRLHIPSPTVMHAIPAMNCLFHLSSFLVLPKV